MVRGTTERRVHYTESATCLKLVDRFRTALLPPWRRIPMGKHRTVMVAVRESPSQFADWRAKAAAAAVSLIAHLVSFERSLLAVAPHRRGRRFLYSA